MKAKVVLALSVIIVVVFGCQSQQFHDDRENRHGQTEYDTLLIQNDTFIYVSFVVDAGVILHWGIDGVFHHTSTDTLYYAKERFRELQSSKLGFVITDGCGTACEYVYTAPWDSNIPGRLLLSPVFVDIENGLIVHQNSGQYLAEVYNMITGIEMVIEAAYDTSIRPQSSVIKECYLLSDSILKLSWVNELGKNTTRRFSIRKVLDP